MTFIAMSVDTKLAWRREARCHYSMYHNPPIPYKEIESKQFGVASYQNLPPPPHQSSKKEISILQVSDMLHHREFDK